MTPTQFYSHAEYHWRATGWIAACLVVGFLIGLIGEDSECDDDEAEDFV
jgi:hypothetical protein